MLKQKRRIVLPVTANHLVASSQRFLQPLQPAKYRPLVDKGHRYPLKQGRRIACSVAAQHLVVGNERLLQLVHFVKSISLVDECLDGRQLRPCAHIFVQLSDLIML